MAASRQGTHYIFTENGFYAESDRLQRLADGTENSESRRYRELYRMGLSERPENLTVTGSYLYLVASSFFKALTALPELEVSKETVRVPLSTEMEEELLRSVPYAIGAEHIDRAWLLKIFGRLEEIFHEEISRSDGTVEEYFAAGGKTLRVPERVYFHLVENPGDTAFPFAFAATYAMECGDGAVRHVPLSHALEETRGDRNKLMPLVSCLSRVSRVSDLVGEFVESGEIFHQLRLTSEEAYSFLKDIEKIEEAGVLCRIPNWWRKKSEMFTLSVRIGERKPALLGLDTLLSLQPSLSVNGETLTEEEMGYLRSQTEGLAFLKGKWVEVDHAKLEKLLAEMDGLPSEITLREAVQTEMGSRRLSPDAGVSVTNGEWLTGLWGNLKNPGMIQRAEVPEGLRAELRPYQKDGYAWLSYMADLGFGACLADDMGLGKTVQVLAYLERLREIKPDAHVLLIVPASLIGNWVKETEKFAPDIVPDVLHGQTSAQLAKRLKDSDAFLTVTTYGMAARMEALQEREWDCLILDEAQAIKNPLAKQTREIKKIRASVRIAMTGTPVENDLGNLWSLFDFLNRGLLGSSKEFQNFCKGLDSQPEGYAKLKSMISPFMLRRVKTDRKIIADLPEKSEMVDYAAMSKKQVMLYRDAVQGMEERIAETDGIERKGLVLAMITKLKQICNHPDQYLGQNVYAPAESGKMLLLKDLCETIYEKRERVLVFTQFREITDMLAAYLKTIFRADGFVLHGGTPAKKRTEIVEAFQGEEYVPFIVLSLKAGGTGLNLTKANHVIHFDRWWNPAVENQATDRAFRIGQTKDVMVHKLVCQGTIEEKIDEIIRSKEELAENVIGSGSESWITELSNEELFSLLRLDMPQAR